MTPEQEDALVAGIYGKYESEPNVYIEDAIRLAIRAAYAKGHADAIDAVNECPTAYCAAAIRRGE